MFEVNANFIKIMDFESEFNRCAESAGISNPFKVQAAQFAKGCRRDKNGDLVYDAKDAPKDAPTEEEKDSFCLTYAFISHISIEGVINIESHHF